VRAHRLLSKRSRAAGVAWLCALAALGFGGLAAPARAQGPVKVLVAVLPFQVHSERPLDQLEQSLVERLTARLEASGKIQVVDKVVVREALVEHVAGERTDELLRKLALQVGAEWVVAGSLTELAGSYSLDVRVTPAGERIASRTMVFTANGDDELRERVEELSDRVIEMVSGESVVSGRVVEVRIEAPGQDADQIRAQLRIRPGRPFDGDALRGDLDRLRARPGVASATAQTERGPDGVVVTFRLVPSEKILGVAEPPKAGERVAEVRITGNKRIEADAIRARIASKPGERYNAAQVAEDVRQIHALGFFSNVKVSAEDTPQGRILTFEVKENPVVRQITIAGNDKIEANRIRDQLTLTTGATLDLPLLYENRDRIEALYRAEGYYQVAVSYEVDNLPNDAVAVHFEVKEGRKLRLTEIRFEGNDHFTQAELRDGMRTKEWHFWSYVTHYLDKSGTYAEPVFMQDMQGVEKKYTDAGYLRVELDEPLVSVEGDSLIVTVHVHEGDRFKVGKLDVSGDPSVDMDKVRPDLELAKDEWFNRSHLTQDVDGMTRRYTDRGYYFAAVSPITKVDDATKVVDVTFDVQKGPLYFVRQIQIAGNTRTVDRVIRREMGLVEGELYSARAVQVSKSRLEGLGYFEEVNFEPQRTDQPDQLDLGVNVVEKSTGALSFGAGYSTQDSIVFSGSVNQSNLFGRGYAVRLSANVGSQRQQFYASFANRRLFDSDFSLATTAFRNTLSYQDFDETDTGFDVTLGRSLDEANTERVFARYGFSIRNINANSNVTAAGLIFRDFFQGDTDTSLVGLSFRADTRNDRVLPTKGYELAMSVDGAGLGGFSKFVRLESRGALYMKIPTWLPIPGREHSSFVLSGRMGYVFPFNSISDYNVHSAVKENFCISSEGCPLTKIDTDLKLPLTERYYLGGLGSFQLRGFKARSVGPRRALLYESIAGPGGSKKSGIYSPTGMDASGNCLNGVTTESGLNLTPLVQGNGKYLKCNSIQDHKNSQFADLKQTDVIGGSQFISLSAEYRFPISEQLGLVGIVFFDTGNAFDENGFLFDVTQWRMGTGVGLLWFSPFGPLEAFIGFPIDKLSVEDSVTFEFSVGGSAL
jgi:outer membrane protein insertion porin family